MTTTIGTMSKIMATEVSLWRQKSVVPEWAEPRLRTRPSGVRMDFAPGGYVMSHSAGDTKSWRKSFVMDALRGRAPSRTDKEFLENTQRPICVYTRPQLAMRQMSVRVGAAIGRFYRRAAR